MLATLRSAAVVGIDAFEVTVEVDIAPGLPSFTLVGLASGAVKESRERVLAALANTGFTVPPRKVVVNLRPADVPKSGTAFDLPIALALLAAHGVLDADRLSRLVVVGELGLDGALRPVRGVLPIARRVAESTALTLVIPPGNVAEASLVSRARLATASQLGDLIAQLRRGALSDVDVRPPVAADSVAHGDDDFADVFGQPRAARALEIAAAGGHNVLLMGPPGAGKTMLARRLAGILPPLSEEEVLEVVALHSVAGVLDSDGARAPRRPFRAPHHTISQAGLIGGGSGPRPGEVSLAHCGVLFLDELLELPRYVLDAMRQPLEDGRVVIARAGGAVAFPARFTLVAAANPCPCGRAGADPSVPCQCSASDVARYRARLSGPLADRIDLHVTVRAVPPALLASRARAEDSATIRARVRAARARQRERYHDLPGVRTNAQAPTRRILDAALRDPLVAAEFTRVSTHAALSARGVDRAVRVARTIADLAGRERLVVEDLHEAVRYRSE